MSIKLAALDCFLAAGYEATTIAQIRARSGASTGSIYHFFSGKPAFAAELFEEAIAGWQAAARNVPDPGSIRGQLTAPAYGLVEWGLQEPRQFRFFNEIRNLLPEHTELAGCNTLLTAHRARLQTAITGLSEQGHLRPLSWPVTEALLLGPALHFLEAVTADETTAPLDPATPEIFAGAAWNELHVR